MEQAINEAYVKGIVIIASASNEGGNAPQIAFPARMTRVICVGSADGDGFQSTFSPSFQRTEKYSAVGEKVSGFDIIDPKIALRLKPAERENHRTIRRRTGSSTAAPVAAGVAALFLDIIRQVVDFAQDEENTLRIRKFFLAMSSASVKQNYRFLAPLTLFTAEKQPLEIVEEILKAPLGSWPLVHRGLMLVVDRVWHGSSELGMASCM